MVDLGNSATLTPNIEAHKIDDIQFMSAGCSYLHLIFTYLMYIKVEALYGDDIHLDWPLEDPDTSPLLT